MFARKKRAHPLPLYSTTPGGALSRPAGKVRNFWRLTNSRLFRSGPPAHKASLSPDPCGSSASAPSSDRSRSCGTDPPPTICGPCGCSFAVYHGSQFLTHAGGPYKPPKWFGAVFRSIYAGKRRSCPHAGGRHPAIPSES